MDNLYVVACGGMAGAFLIGAFCIGLMEALWKAMNRPPTQGRPASLRKMALLAGILATLGAGGIAFGMWTVGVFNRLFHWDGRV